MVYRVFTTYRGRVYHLSEDCPRIKDEDSLKEHKYESEEPDRGIVYFRKECEICGDGR